MLPPCCLASCYIDEQLPAVSLATCYEEKQALVRNPFAGPAVSLATCYEEKQALVRNPFAGPAVLLATCYEEKRALVRNLFAGYRLGDAESPGDSSEEEEITVPKKATPKRTPSTKGSTSASLKAAKQKAQVESDEEKYGGDTDSAEDTDEEIRRAVEQTKAKKEPAKSPQPKGKASVKGKAEVKFKPDVKDTTPDLGIFADSTDEDEPANNNAVAMDTDEEEEDSGLPDLPDFFADKHFFFYGNLDSAEKRLLTRYIAAYDGVLEDYMTDRVKFVVTASSWDDTFQEAVLENPNLVFVRPEWIRCCHNSSKLVALKPYTLVP